jgi:hypothetical protein
MHKDINNTFQLENNQMGLLQFDIRGPDKKFLRAVFIFEKVDITVV